MYPDAVTPPQAGGRLGIPGLYVTDDPGGVDDAAKTGNLQAGILDVNLGGEKTYAVADILTNRKIPFAFVTGYGPDSIVSAFSHAPVLQKLIEAAKLHALLQQIVR